MLHSQENSPEVLREMRTSCIVFPLDFSPSSFDTTPETSLKIFFAQCEAQGLNPRLPEQRQAFNHRCLQFLKKKYLLGRYGENRASFLQGSKIAREGRTIHLGVDFFCKELEPVYAPYSGTIVRIGYEPGDREYGHYLILRHVLNGEVLYSFFGHLGKAIVSLGPVKAGERIATLGDFEENGGWSRHLHFQLLRQLPLEGTTPPGYATPENFPNAQKDFPSPYAFLQIPGM